MSATVDSGNKENLDCSDLRPVIPDKGRRGSRHVLVERRLQLSIEVELGCARQPVDTVLVVIEAHVDLLLDLVMCRGITGYERLVCVPDVGHVMSQDLNIDFEVVVLVKEYTYRGNVSILCQWAIGHSYSVPLQVPGGEDTFATVRTEP